MKKIVLTLFAATCVALPSFGQCCPYIDGIEVLPAHPSSDDTIYIVTHVSTTDNGIYLGSDVFHLGNTLRVEGCYFNGSVTSQENSYTDTLEIGTKPVGSYTLEFEAYLSDHDMVCNLRVDSTMITSGFNVGYAGLDGSTAREEFHVYPNPVPDGRLFVRSAISAQPLTFRLYNTLGEAVLEGTPGSSGVIHVDNLRGIFFLVIYQGDAVEQRKVVIL